MSNPTLPLSSVDNLTRKDLYDQTEDMRQEISQQVELIHADATAQVFQAESEHRINLVLERLGANEEKTRIEIDHRFSRYFLWIALAFFLLVSLAAVNYFQILNPQAGESVFELSEPQIIGSADLCPGDSLFFKTDAKVTDAGVYRLAMSTWKISPLPATYAFSEGLDMVMAESREFPIEILWVVPPTFKNLATGKNEKWPSGDYSRDLAVTATGRNTTSTPRQVKFTIRDNCPNRAAAYHSPLYTNP